MRRYVGIRSARRALRVANLDDRRSTIDATHAEGGFRDRPSIRMRKTPLVCGGNGFTDGHCQYR